MIFQDNTISITPISPTSEILDGYAIKGISIEGIQTQIKVIDQILDTFISSPGIVSNTDSLVESIQKIASTLATNYTTIHITSDSSSNTNLTEFQRFVIIDSNVTGKTVTLPTANASGVIAGVDYTFMVGSDVITSNTIAVPSGSYLNNVLNGTYTLTGLLTNWLRVSAISDGSRWFLAG